MNQSLHEAECVGVDARADIGLRLVIISELRTLTLHESNVTSRLVAVVQTRVRSSCCFTSLGLISTGRLVVTRSST